MERYRVAGFSNHQIYSRELGMSAVLDFNGDGIPDLLVPDAKREALRVVTFANGQFRQILKTGAIGPEHRQAEHGRSGRRVEIPEVKAWQFRRREPNAANIHALGAELVDHPARIVEDVGWDLVLDVHPTPVIMRRA